MSASRDNGNLLGAGASSTSQEKPTSLLVDWVVGVIVALFCFILCLVLGTLASSSSAQELFNSSWPKSVFDCNECRAILIAVCIAFGINVAVWIPCSIVQTEKFYDITGMISFLTVMITQIVLSSKSTSSTGDASSPWTYVTCGFTICWTLRLGTFLFRRVLASPHGDRRFDVLKLSPGKFLIPWALQGMWVFLSSLPVLVQMNSTPTVENRFAFEVAFRTVGIFVWVLGFGVEIISDRQKTIFALNTENKGKFISSGLWSLSRHPNYFGEMTLWVGVFLVGVPVYSGTEWVCAISPVFIISLISFVSGIPQLEAYADKKWGDSVDYQEYKKQTPVLIPNVFLICK